MYLVIICYKCGRLLLAKRDQKTRQCPYCKTRIQVGKARQVAKVETARQASEIIRLVKKNSLQINDR